MRITEINISEFGCLKAKVLKPGKKMNIIYGENESGKSTVMLFIKFMLYGFGRNIASNSDRERSVSWSGHTAAGSMSFEHGGKNYRIERRYVDGARKGNEKITVVCLDDGTEINPDKSVGEYFLGVPKEVFESSAYVGQMRTVQIDGEKTAASIRNMLSSADEAVDTAKILKNLDAVRVGYMHKNKSGGSLYEIEQRIMNTRRKLEGAKEAAFSLDEYVEKLERARADYLSVKEELEQKEDLLSEMNRISILTRFEALKNTCNDKSRCIEKKEKLTCDSLKTEFFPDRNHNAELRLSIRACYDANKELDRLKAQTEEKVKKDYDEELSRLGEKLEKNGGAQAVLDYVQSKKRVSRLHNGVIAAVWGAQVALSAAATVLLLSGMLWGAALFAFIVPALILTIKSISTKRKLKREIFNIAAEYGTDVATLPQRLEKCSIELLKYRENLLLCAKAKSELETAERYKATCWKRVDELLKKTLVQYEPTLEIAAREAERLERFVEEYDILSKEEETLSRIIKNEELALSSYDLENLQSSVKENVCDVTPASIAEAQRVRGFLAAKKSSLEQRVISLGNAVAELRAKSADPLLIADELAELEAKYSCDREFYEALTLAMEAIGQAGQVMSGSVMPVIAKRAGEIMGRISDEKYTVLRATGSFGISLDSDGFGIKSEHLSGGTRDAAYLALRIALFTRIYGENMPPLILDEALCQLDDARAERLLMMLHELTGEDIQCLCFTSHKREQEICNRNQIEYGAIRL